MENFGDFLKFRIKSKALSFIIRFAIWIVGMTLMLAVLLFVCSAIAGLSYAVIEDADASESAEMFIGWMADSESEKASEIYKNTFMKHLPFDAVFGDVYSGVLDDMLEDFFTGSADYEIQDVFFSSLKGVLDYFTGENRSFFKTLSQLFPDIIQSFIAGIFIYFLFGLNYVPYLVCFGNKLSLALTKIITGSLYGITGYWCAAAVKSFIYTRFSGVAALVVFSLVGIILVLIQSLSQAGVFGSIFAYIRIRRGRLIESTRVSLPSFISRHSKLNKNLLLILPKLILSIAFGILNSIFVWMICACFSSVVSETEAFLYSLSAIVLLFSLMLWLQMWLKKKVKA